MGLLLLLMAPIVATLLCAICITAGVDIHEHATEIAIATVHCGNENNIHFHCRFLFGLYAYIYMHTEWRAAKSALEAIRDSCRCHFPTGLGPRAPIHTYILTFHTATEGLGFNRNSYSHLPVIARCFRFTCPTTVMSAWLRILLRAVIKCGVLVGEGYLGCSLDLKISIWNSQNER